MTVKTIDIIRAHKQLWANYLSNKTKERKEVIESYEALEWSLVTQNPSKEPPK